MIARTVAIVVIVLAATTGRTDLITPSPSDMRPVMWADDDGRFWRLNFMTAQIEPCGDECSRNLADNWRGCWR